MNSTKANNRSALSKVLLINLLVFVVSISIIWIIFSYLESNVDKKIASLKPDANMIRAEYPNYNDFDADYAKSIFSDYVAPESGYKSFTGYRRKGYKGTAVEVDFKTGFRKSLNHSIDKSVWFLGGSTIWGTGADDKSTIPSYFSEITGYKVLNLGESGYNSFQELIQLQIMLARGYKPDFVIFYDGVNDGYQFCQKDDIENPRHAYTSRYIKQKDDLEKVKEKLKNNSIMDFEQFIDKSYEVFLTPYRYMNKLEKLEETRQQKISSTPFEEIKVSKKYLHCDEQSVAQEAARITVFSWLTAAQLLETHGIASHFILQPAATFEPEKYQLDYIIDYKKKAIVNESVSYKGYYTAVLEEWEQKCSTAEICGNFSNLSQIFFDKNEPIFLDTAHISPNGNRIVAEAIAQVVDIQNSVLQV